MQQNISDLIPKEERNIIDLLREIENSENPTAKQDCRGFLYTPNGSFFDPDGNYFNRNGYDIHGGRYDNYGVYIPGEGWNNELMCYDSEIQGTNEDNKRRTVKALKDDNDLIYNYFREKTLTNDKHKNEEVEEDVLMDLEDNFVMEYTEQQQQNIFNACIDNDNNYDFRATPYKTKFNITPQKFNGTFPNNENSIGNIGNQFSSYQ